MKGIKQNFNQDTLVETFWFMYKSWHQSKKHLGLHRQNPRISPNHGSTSYFKHFWQFWANITLCRGSHSGCWKVPSLSV